MPTNVLIVLDGGYWFGNPADPTQAPAAGKAKDFTFLTLVDALTSAGMVVSKAHLESDSTADTGMQNFTFTSATLNTELYDVVWLIGLRGRNVTGASAIGGLGEPQLKVIADFMDAGGGVFATGDHDSLGSDMNGHLIRVRAMRAWYGAADPASPWAAAPISPEFDNFSPLGSARADTTRLNPQGDYDQDNDGTDENFAWFENQSDSVPQPITLTSPTHRILRHNGADVEVWPDHMHEGNTLGEVAAYDYGQTVSVDGQNFVEFPTIAGQQPKPTVIANGTVLQKAVANVPSTSLSAEATPKTVNTMSVYNGRIAGVGRAVTGATFHHYIDINLTGDTDINTAALQALTGPDAEKGVGFNANPAVFEQIKAVYVNITNWLARPRPEITLYLERSTFGVDEVTGNPNFTGVLRVTVDGLKPSDFPGGPVTTGAFNAAWAPSVTPAGAGFISITPTAVFSDDPTMPERLQRFTFIYDVEFSNNTFGDQTVPVNASLTTPVSSATLTDTAFFQLVTSANPYMLDLENGNDRHWLSSDLKVFPVVAGDTVHGVTLPTGATRAQAYTFINDLKNSITPTQFENLAAGQAASALSPLPQTTISGENVYNFAIAQVRRNGTLLAANDVRVFFRIFNSQTTAALTYNALGGVPVEGYLKNPGTAPGTNHIALPGISNSQWLSFPCFSENRNANRDAQDDNENVRTISNTDDEEFFGVLLDTNLGGGYLPSVPGGGGTQSLQTLLTDAHQCLVAQIEFGGTPIPSGSRPSTSDKLAQRNIAYSEVANPGMTASRAAIHTFEIEATPRPVSEDLPPDELIITWPKEIPHGTYARIHIPNWNAEDVVELADRFYARHEISVIDDHTIEIPGGGMRYVPIPQNIYRQTGVLTVELPLGIKRGQRFDVSVQQISNQGRDIKLPEPKVEQIKLQEAEKLIAELGLDAAAKAKKGAFDIGRNKTLVTDLSLFDAQGDFALVIHHPDPKKLAAVRAEARMWRETVGAFTLGIPVSTKKEMQLDQMRLFSLLSWRLANLPRDSRWYATMKHYLGLLAEKVEALGGKIWEIPATPDGVIPQLPWVKDDGGEGNGKRVGGETGDGNSGENLLDPNNPLTRGCLIGLLLALLILIALLIIRSLWG